MYYLRIRFVNLIYFINKITITNIMEISFYLYCNGRLFFPGFFYRGLFHRGLFSEIFFFGDFFSVYRCAYATSLLFLVSLKMKLIIFFGKDGREKNSVQRINIRFEPSYRFVVGSDRYTVVQWRNNNTES